MNLKEAHAWALHKERMLVLSHLPMHDANCFKTTMRKIEVWMVHSMHRMPETVSDVGQHACCAVLSFLNLVASPWCMPSRLRAMVCLDEQ
jgi:hypothetical protein